jgi:hypothetical protein
VVVPSYVNMMISSDANKGPDVPSATVEDSNGDIAFDTITEEISRLTVNNATPITTHEAWRAAGTGVITSIKRYRRSQYTQHVEKPYLDNRCREDIVSLLQEEVPQIDYTRFIGSSAAIAERRTEDGDLGIQRDHRIASSSLKNASLLY